MENSTLKELSPREETIAYLKMLARQLQKTVQPTNPQMA